MLEGSWKSFSFLNARDQHGEHSVIMSIFIQPVKLSRHALTLEDVIIAHDRHYGPGVVATGLQNHKV